MRKRSYGRELFRACSQVLNTLTGGSADITFSTRTQIAYLQGKRWGKIMRAIVNGLFYFRNSDHCAAALRNEIKSLQSNLEYLNNYLP